MTTGSMLHPMLPLRALLSTLRGVARTRSGRVGLAIMLLMVALAVAAPWIAPSGPLDLAGAALQPPSWLHPMGTDNVGHDLLSVVLYGGRASLSIGLFAALIAFLIGGTIGALAGYLRGPVELVLMRVAELFQTLPVVIVVLFIVAVLGTSFWLLIGAVALAIWPLEARIVYGQFVALSDRPFVAAARAADLSTAHIVLREILPNALPPVIVQVALDASLAILISAGLGFLGLSDPSVPSWGELLNRGQTYLDSAWWMSVFPGVAICIAVLGLNLLADGLNEAGNPRASATTARLQA